MMRSQTILGRTQNRKAFDKRRPFRVSVFQTYQGKILYSDATQAVAPSPCTLYRVRVIPNRKQPVREIR